MPLEPRRTERTESSYESAMTTFFEFAGEKSSYTEDDIRRVVAKLEKTYSPGYVKYILSVCKVRLGDGWPRDLPKYKVYRNDVQKPVLPAGSIERMIHWAKGPTVNSLLRGYLVVSTLYGTRCTELADLDVSDVTDQSIYIRTAKGGIDRHMWLPPAVRLFVQCAGFVPTSDSRMRAMFKLIAHSTGIEVGSGMGWHSIRRALTSYLKLYRTDLTQTLVKKFLRWSESDISDHYVVEDGFRIDMIVFRNHPYLRAWEA